MKLGNLLHGRVRMYPDDCLQSLTTDWWVKNEERKLCRGALVFAFVPHVDQIPYTFATIGRTQADQHDSAILRYEPLRINQPRKKTELPVAAMPLNAGELWAAYRAKQRPCLVIGSNNPMVDRALTQGMARHSTAPTVLAAPYYGVNQDGKRAGYKPKIVECIRHCDYPQFVWDRLPIPGGPQESILRLDHLQPIGTHYISYELSEFKLSSEAFEIIDAMVQWVLRGKVEEDTLVAMYREHIEETFSL